MRVSICYCFNFFNCIMEWNKLLSFPYAKTSKVCHIISSLFLIFRNSWNWSLNYMYGMCLNSKVIVNFVRSNIFCRFGVPRAIISCQGSDFCNRSLESMLKKYGVVHRVLQLIIPKLMGKWKFLIERSNMCCRR